jgi:Zn-dependent M32 family carboxypeptidase
MNLKEFLASNYTFMTQDDIAKKNIKFLNRELRKAMGLPLEPTKEQKERLSEYDKIWQKFKKNPTDPKLRKERQLAFFKLLGISPERAEKHKEFAKKYDKIWQRFKKNPFDKKVRKESRLAFLKLVGISPEKAKKRDECFKEYDRYSQKFKTNPFVPIYI